MYIRVYRYSESETNVKHQIWKWKWKWTKTFSVSNINCWVLIRDVELRLEPSHLLLFSVCFPHAVEVETWSISINDNWPNEVTKRWPIDEIAINNSALFFRLLRSESTKLLLCRSIFMTIGCQLKDLIHLNTNYITCIYNPRQHWFLNSEIWKTTYIKASHPFLSHCPISDGKKFHHPLLKKIFKIVTDLFGKRLLLCQKRTYKKWQ